MIGSYIQLFNRRVSDTLTVDCQLSIVNLFHSLFQCGGVELAEIDSVHAEFAGQEEGFRNIFRGRDHFAVLLCLREKISRMFGTGGIVQIKDPNDGLIPDSHIRTDVDVHKNLRFFN